MRAYGPFELRWKLGLLATWILFTGWVFVESGDPLVWAVGGGAAIVFAFFALRRPLRRARLLRAPFPARWREVLEAQVPFYQRLDGAGRRRFENDVRFVLAEHRFEGVDGVVATDELRLLVAAAAAMLLHGRPGWELPAGRSILLYPGSFDERYVATGGPILGQAHGQGPLIFSVPSLRHGFADPGDGENVALHELAHALDFEQARADGVPAQLAPRAVGPWLRLLHRERDRIFTGESALRDYAASSEAELFAVAVEQFFEAPRELREKSPQLYEALAQFFAQDPASV